MSIKITIPKACASFEGAFNCPFCYDSIYCNAYERRLGDIDEYKVRPEWCKLKRNYVIKEKGD